MLIVCIIICETLNPEEQTGLPKSTLKNGKSRKKPKRIKRIKVLSI